ncbi:putative two-component system response regulator [Acetitomaculum ruminis DSM 5522]|uniref:Stage 0 sporulation protein A homolog n=1 Tax=Acetitomaculum ruminis DSM 5522 TaxID=1120918 RepID=A0A1I0VIF1_9FIRM|nr:HD domain-containing phosphohydrolase [Acetitomaculum ruminis]SFA75823.1 putative two-component system response regulator [Acetitomaculum ruminis DSM 5522]
MVSGRKKIIIIEDEEINRGILRELFRTDFDILEAENGQEGLSVIEKEHTGIAAVLLDIMMPVLDGFGLLEILNQKNYIKEFPVILITGDYTLEVEKKAYALGITELIIKPFNREVVIKRVKNVIELYENKNHLKYLVDIQTKQIKKQAKILEETNEQLIDILSTVVEFRNFESGQHIKNIKKFVSILLRHLMEEFPEYGIDNEIAAAIVKASVLHDIGKIAIPDAILLKPGKLTGEEYEIMQTHTIKGCEILKRIRTLFDDFLYEYIYEICRYHHEKWDGNGYPDKLSGEAIPISAQLVSIADCYDALRSKRVYKIEIEHELAIDMIKDGACGEFSDKMKKLLDLSEQEFFLASSFELSVNEDEIYTCQEGI